MKKKNSNAEIGKKKWEEGMKYGWVEILSDWGKNRCIQRSEDILIHG